MITFDEEPETKEVVGDHCWPAMPLGRMGNKCVARREAGQSFQWPPIVPLVQQLVVLVIGIDPRGYRCPQDRRRQWGSTTMGRLAGTKCSNTTQSTSSSLFNRQSAGRLHWPVVESRKSLKLPSTLEALVGNRRLWAAMAHGDRCRSIQ